MPEKTYYGILEIRENASQREIREAYKKLALKKHPDKNPGIADKATEEFKKVQKAYEILSDPSSRASYDATLPDDKGGYWNDTIVWANGLKRNVRRVVATCALKYIRVFCVARLA